MEQSVLRVRRATPGDVDNVALAIAARLPAGQAPSADRLQYVFFLIVTEPGAEVYVAESGGQVVGFATVYYLEYLSRGGLSAIVTEVVQADAAREDEVATALLRRVREAATARRCRRIDLHAGQDQHALVAAAERLGFEASAHELSLVLV